MDHRDPVPGEPGAGRRYDQTEWPYAVDDGDRLLTRCEGDESVGRAEVFPPRLEIDAPGGQYVLVDDGPPHLWVYVWVAR